MTQPEIAYNKGKRRNKRRINQMTVRYRDDHAEYARQYYLITHGKKVKRRNNATKAAA